MIHGLIRIYFLIQSPQFWEIVKGVGDVLAQPAATTVAGLIVAYSATLAFKASRESRESTEMLAAKTDKREREVARHDRYGRIAEQLASKKPSIQIAGVYSLSALSDEWQAENNDALRDSCRNLLCSHLRGLPRTKPQHDEHRTAIFSVIDGHTQESDEHRWEGSEINLLGAQVYGASLFGADLSLANMSYMEMIHADFVDCSFRATWLIEAVLKYAVLDNVDFDTANLSGVDAEKSTWNSVMLRNAVLYNANFEGAVFKKTYFGGANLTCAHFEGADLTGADFGNPGEDEARFWAPRSPASLWGFPTWDEHTKWPLGFDIWDTLARQMKEND